MNYRSTMPLFAAAAVAALTACSKPADTVETKSQTSTTTPQGQVETSREVKQAGDTLVVKSETKSQTEEGTVKTTREAKQVGNTLEVKTETKSKTDEGLVKTTTNTYVGTVTVYEPGKKIEVLTGAKARHAVALNAKSLQVTVAGKVVVGSHVRLVEEKSDHGTQVRITVVTG